MFEGVHGSLNKWLSHFLLLYRSTPRSTTGRSPVELFLKRRLWTRFSLLKSGLGQTIENRQEKQRKHDKTDSRDTRIFRCGDRVGVKSFRCGKEKWLWVIVTWLRRGRHDRPRLGLNRALPVLPALRVCQEAVLENTLEFKLWMVSHTECNKIFRGTYGGMEVEAVEILWNRSLERNFRYTTMVSDGDSKSFKHLTNTRAYGDVELHKEEYINHVAKRLGTGLRKLAASGKKSGITLGGRGFGRLAQATIVKLTAYYGKAVRAHRGNLPAKTNAVWAIFDHATSTDEKPKHDRC